MESPFLVLSQVARVLEQHEIDYAPVGSLASSMHGMYRSTADIDLLADIKPEQVRALLDALNKSFYVDEHAVWQAVEQRRSFNAIHFDSVFKVDIFIAKADDFARKQLERRELRKMLRRSTSSFMLLRLKIQFWQNSAGTDRAMRSQAPSGLTF